MLTREKEQLADSVKFLESELKNADSNLLEKEKELNAIKAEKEREVCSVPCVMIIPSITITIAIILTICVSISICSIITLS